MKSKVVITGIIVFWMSWLAFDPLSRLVQPFFADRWQSPTTISKDEETKIPPSQISFPTLSKTLPVSAGLVKDGEWDLYTDKVTWLASSEVPGEGNVVIYGHNWQNLFGDLHKLEKGDEIIVTQGYDEVAYQVREFYKVDASDVNAIISEQNQLTLYTCDGIFDQKRLVVYADPI